jgi:excisionase family DNA binding protein
MKTIKALLSPADLAPLLGVSRSRVYQLIAAGVIPATRMGNRIRIPRGAWERWLATETDRALAGTESVEPQG